MKGPGDDARKEGEKEKSEEDKERERAVCVIDFFQAVVLFCELWPGPWPAMSLEQT